MGKTLPAPAQLWAELKLASSIKVCTSLGGFTPNWATLKVIGLVKIALGGHVKIGLVFTHWAGKNSLGREPKFGLFLTYLEQ